MISRDTYISTLITIIMAALFEILKKGKTKIVVPLVTFILMLILTIIYKCDADTSYIVNLCSKFMILPFSKRAFTDLPNDEIISILVYSLLINLLSYYFLIFNLKEGKDFYDIQLRKKYLIITIAISFVITLYLHILLIDLTIYKLFAVINNDMLTYFLYGVLLFSISFFEAWLLSNLNFYLSFKTSKSK